MTNSTGIETFISYARKDGLAHAERLERELPNTWRDKRNLDPFKDFTVEIERAIDACKQVIAVITPDTMREDSFVRRELARAVRKKKPIIVVRFDDIDPPIIVETNTWSEWFKNGWDKTLDEIRQWIVKFVPSYTPPTLVEVLRIDPYRDYLGTLYDGITDYLDQVIIKEVTLKAKHAKDAVANEVKRSPLGNLYRRSGVNEPEIRIETLKEGVDHFKGRVLLLGEPGAGKTVSLLAAARDAVVRRLNDPKAPLPVWLRCAEWPSENKTSLSDWIEQQHNLTLTIFDDTFIFFDGFDELGTSRVRKVKDRDGNEGEETYDPRPLFLEIIPPTGQVLLSCRIKEYEDFGAKVNLRGAVTLRPLENSQIKNYLSDLPDLWIAISSDADLLEMMRTPLLLSLFAFGYRDVPEDVRALRDLKAAQLSEAIFKQYVEKRYEHEARRFEEMDKTPPFTLDEIYNILGRVAMHNACGGALIQDNVLSLRDFEIGLGNKIDVQSFIHYSTLLHLLAPIQASMRFTHLRLRDHFIRNYCYPRIADERFYLRGRFNPALALTSLPNAEAFTIILGQMRHHRYEVRHNIALALGILGDIKAIDILIAALKDKSSNVRHTAAYALGLLSESQAVKPLIYKLTDRSSNVRVRVVEALGKIGNKQAVEPLISMLKDKNEFVCCYAAEALGQFHDTRAVEPLINLLMMRVGFAKHSAIKALVQLSKLNLKPLIIALNDKDKNVRSGVAEALGQIGSKKATKSLINALNDEESEVRIQVAHALGMIGDVKTVGSLISVLNDKESLVRVQIAYALGKIGGIKALEPLVSLLKDDDAEVRIEASRALGKIGSIKSVAPLLSMLKDKDNRVRMFAIEALGNIDSDSLEVIETLKFVFFKEKNKYIRLNTVIALGKVGGNRAMEILIIALNNEDIEVRNISENTLTRIGTPEALQALADWRKRNTDK